MTGFETRATAELAPMPSPPSSTSESLTRVRLFVEVAAANGSSISLEELLDVLPPDVFPSPQHLQRCIAADEDLSAQLTAVGNEVTLRGQEVLAIRRQEQRNLADGRVAEASRFLAKLGTMSPWIELAAVSGSTAYGGAKPGDDVDLFLVVREHRLWLTLLLGLALARYTRLRSRTTPIYCFNRTIERRACIRAFEEGRDALFAREALNLRILRGESCYRALLKSAPWMAEHFPIRYATRIVGAKQASERPSPADSRAGWLFDAGALIFLGPYLWLSGLARNYFLRRGGRGKECFRTVVRRDFYATESIMYDELREEYRKAFTW